MPTDRKTGPSQHGPICKIRSAKYIVSPKSESPRPRFYRRKVYAQQPRPPITEFRKQSAEAIRFRLYFLNEVSRKASATSSVENAEIRLSVDLRQGALNVQNRPVWLPILCAPRCGGQQSGRTAIPIRILQVDRQFKCPHIHLQLQAFSWELLRDLW